MTHTLKKILFIFLFETLFAQFRTELPINTLPTNLNGELDKKSSLFSFNPENLDINYGFTMSMLSSKGQSQSVAGFTNNISYMLKENLKLDANITLYKSQTPFNPNSNFSNGLDIAYDAGLTFKPSENSFLQFRFQKIPFYQRSQNNQFLHSNY